MTRRIPARSAFGNRAAFLVFLVLSALLLQAAESETNTPSEGSFSSYRIIIERNIFNTNRAPRMARSNRPAEKPKQVDSFALVGTLSYEKGYFAFFDGTSSAFKKVCQMDGAIAGFTVKEITATGVKLTDGTNHFDLTVGMQMKREDESPWRLSASSEAMPPSRPEESSSSSTTASDGPVSDILKRLKEKREKELK